jgi:hypothetical protein
VARTGTNDPDGCNNLPGLPQPEPDTLISEGNTL